ncbi:UNVERIFIED_CONTAM: hypothetical protein GTU68_029943, partial [Idotea baltica]|nr:hypothetical protein [Idotea baltica]
MIYRGFKDVKDSIDPAISEEQARTVMAAFQQQLQEEQMKKMQQDAVENEILGQKFLEDNLAREGVKELPSGLQYKVLASGSGESPELESQVKAKYAGRLIDGTQFDTSDDDPRGFREFGVNQVIPGWTEALQLMKPGDKWEIYIPGNLAYGQAGRGPSIPPNATLIFELELLEV